MSMNYRSTRTYQPGPRQRSQAPSWLAAGAALVLLGVVVVWDSGKDSTDQPSTQAGEQIVASEVSPEVPGVTKFTVVVPDAPIADLVRQVAGPAVYVTAVVPIGVSGHTYEPRPEDARTMADADMYIESGLGLNDVVTAFASSNYPSGTPHFALAEEIPQADLIASDSAAQVASHGHAHSFNAHFWPDPNYAVLYVNRIAEVLSGFDPSDADGYSARAASLVAQLQQMDQMFRSAIATIPEQNRKLVVYHDSWSYFGRRYGLPVVGAIQPTDFSEPSAAELRATIDQVRAAGVPAFFGSEVFPSDVLEVIEQESGAEYVADLSDDRLPGDPGTPVHTYIGMMVANTRAIVTALGGDATSLNAIDPAFL